MLAECARANATQVVFEAPHRIEALAVAWAQACPTRRLTVARELTKQFETVHTLAALEFPAWLAADAHRDRGEFVLVLHARAEAADATQSASHDATLRTLLAALSLKQAVALAAALTGAPRNELYERALFLREEDAGE
jgi:16S rRNA (cytidine1402-2'-O)-methyltransferase